MSVWHWWGVILGAGLGTYALRAAPFAWQQLYDLGRRNQRFLTYVSLAIAAGIVSRSVVFAEGRDLAGAGDVGIELSAIAVALVARRVLRNVPAALFAGVGTAVALKALVG